MDNKDVASVGVVIPAAGKGLRLGGTRKQFRVLDGKPVLYWTIKAFDDHELVDFINIAAPHEDVRVVQDILESEGIQTPFQVVPGGTTRQASVHNAIQRLPKNVNTILVHDGVRPFVRSEMISNVISAIKQAGAAAVAISVTDTLRKGVEGTFLETVSREGLFRMQTPQGAHRTQLEHAFAMAIEKGWQVTDDVNVLQLAGYPVQIVEGSSLNIKITTRADWEMACLIWSVWNQ